MLTLADVKAHLKLDPTATDEDVLLTSYLTSAIGAFKVESKRRWPVAGEPALVKVLDPAAIPPLTVFDRYVDPAALSPDEQSIAQAWLLLTVAHFYENRQPVLADVRAVAVEVPLTVRKLMDLVREPTL